jgi:hypothetical protein
VTELQRLKALSDLLGDKLEAEHRKQAINHAKYEAVVSALMDTRHLIDVQVREVEKREQAGMVPAK